MVHISAWQLTTGAGTYGDSSQRWKMERIIQGEVGTILKVQVNTFHPTMQSRVKSKAAYIA